MLKLRRLLPLLFILALALPALAQDATETATPWPVIYDTTVALGSSDTMGDYLVGPNGMTLYIFTHDPLDSSVCSGRCATAWPSLTVDSANNLTAPDGVPGDLGTITRDDGTLQVTYNGMPLYYWFRDAQPGDMTGQGVGNSWWIVPPATVYANPEGDVGTVLVGPKGMTLYHFTNDAPGVSNCSGQCLANWPPLLVDSADAVVSGENLLGELGTITRDDGTIQVTYNGWPLYYWKDDHARGDILGEGVGQKWYTVAPETVGVSSTDALGDFLVSYSGRTLYTFSNDTEGVSNCADDCATNWPPFTVGEYDKVSGIAAVGGTLGTITRADGAIQVTYNGMPLYFFKDDHVPGDTTGQGAGDKWFVVAP
jgi:predicted lipoprotein with Yx(FWY)xxD motif